MNSFEKRAKKVAGYTPKKSNNSGNLYRDDSFAKRADDIVKRNTIQKLRDKTEARRKEQAKVPASGSIGTGVTDQQT